MRTDRLIVFAGPPCSGKSTIVQRLLVGDLPDLANSLQLRDPHSWTYIPAFKVHELKESHLDRAILHYDILRPWKLGGHYGDDPALELLASSSEVAIVTLWAPADVLSRRLKRRQLKSFLRSGLVLDRQGMRNSIRAFKVNSIFRKHQDFCGHYDSWLAFCGAANVTGNWLLDTTRETGELIEARDGLVNSLARMDSRVTEVNR